MDKKMLYFNSFLFLTRLLSEKTCNIINVFFGVKSCLVLTPRQKWVFERNIPSKVLRNLKTLENWGVQKTPSTDTKKKRVFERVIPSKVLRNLQKLENWGVQNTPGTDTKKKASVWTNRSIESTPQPPETGKLRSSKQPGTDTKKKVSFWMDHSIEGTPQPPETIKQMRSKHA